LTLLSAIPEISFSIGFNGFTRGTESNTGLDKEAELFFWQQHKQDDVVTTRPRMIFFKSWYLMWVIKIMKKKRK
jgi:hypothetical protein